MLDASALKNANIITVSADCFRFSEVLLQTSFFGTETSGSHHASFQSVMRHECDTRQDVYVDIVRMRWYDVLKDCHDEVQGRCRCSISAKVLDREWRVSVFPRHVPAVEEFDESGPTIVLKRV